MYETRDGVQAVRVALAMADRTLTDAAGDLGVKVPALSRLLSAGSPLDARSHWPALLEALGIEVVFRVKPRDAK